MSTAEQAIDEMQQASRLALGLRYHRGLKHGLQVGLVVGCCTTGLAMWLAYTVINALARGC